MKGACSLVGDIYNQFFFIILPVTTIDVTDSSRTYFKLDIMPPYRHHTVPTSDISKRINKSISARPVIRYSATHPK